MKLKSNRFLAISVASAAALSSSALAQTTWNGSVGGSWSDAGNWSAGVPDSADLVTYGAGNGVGIAVTNGTQTLDASRAVSGFSVGNNAASPIIINGGAGSNTLTIGASGILLNSGTGGNFTSNADIIMSAAQSFTTGTARSITANNVSNGGFLLTVNTAGTTSTTAINGLLSGTGGLTKSGPGTLTIFGVSNTFGGQVSLGGGTTSITKLATIGSNSSLGTGNGASSLIINGGTLTYTGAGGDTTNRAIDMRASAVINNNSGTGTISFTAANVIQGGTASARTLTLGGSNAGNNTFSSILGNSGTGSNISTLQKNGIGKWVVTGVQTYTGATIINQGILSVDGSTVLGGTIGSTADAGNIVFGTVNANGTLEFETSSNLGAADQIRFRNTGGTAGQGGALVYTGTTEQTLGKTIQCDSSIGIRIESNSVGGSLTLDGAFSQTNRPLFLGGTGTGGNTLATNFTGTGGITKRDSGTWILSGTNNTYTGATTVSAGTLLVNGSLGNTAVSVSDAAMIGGSGSVAGTLSFGGSSFFDVFLADPLAVTGTVSFGSGFGIDNLKGIDWDNMILETPYTILNSVQDFSTAGLDNWGIENAVGVGTPALGRSAYFQNGSLQLVVIPEPSIALLGGLGLLGLLRRRRGV